MRLGGLVIGLRTTIVKSGPNEGRKMAFFRLEDFAGSASCVMFSKAYAEHAALLTNDRVVVIEGDVDASRDEPTVRVTRVVPMEDAPHVFARGLLVRLADASPATLESVKRVLSAHAGPLAVALEFHPDARSRVVVKAGGTWSVAADASILDRVRAVTGVRGAEFLAREP